MHFTSEQFQFLSSADTLKLIESELRNNVERYNAAKDARWFVTQLFPKIHDALTQQGNNGLLQQYQEIVHHCNWISFIMLTEDETLELFAHGLITMTQLSDNIELDPKLRGRLVAITDHAYRNTLKKKWQNAMLSNTETLSRQPLVVNQENRGTSIGVWLRFYLSQKGYDLVDPIERQQFILASPQVRVLSETEKQQLLKLIEVLEFTKRDSTKPEGVEETILFRKESGEVVSIKDNVAEPINERMLRQAEEFLALEQQDKVLGMKEIFLGDEQERGKIRQFQLNMIQQNLPLKDALLNAIQHEEPLRAHAALKLLSQKGTLMNVVSADPQFETMVREGLSKRFSETAQLAFHGVTDPIMMSVLLQEIYQTHLQLGKTQSARFAAQLEALLVKSGAAAFRGMVYADPDKNAFFWTPIVEENGRLKFS
ncbi:MAG: hypothetical protein HYZ08_00435 [Candidatus Kerfeldbacteria bacterium]|nr:hypothetical protein [Candidatus Kerfeldbacteria bacterium]